MIPSYDDLTPGIPDVLDSKSVDQLALFLREDLKRRSEDQETAGQKQKKFAPDLLSSCRPVALYACLRSRDQSPNHQIPRSPNPLLAVARDFSPRVMRVSGQEILLDVSGLGRLIGEPPAIAAALARAIAGMGLAARVAIAPTQTAARLLAMVSDIGHRPAQTNTGCIARALAPLPVSLLTPLETLPPAINHRDRARPYETFERWGIATLGDLAALPAAELSSRLGRRGVALQRLARGLDPRPFVPDADTPRYIGRLELEWPLDTLEPLSFVFARLLEPLSAALERADRGAAAIRLDLRLTTRETYARVLQLPAPMRDPKVLRTLLLLNLESSPLFRGASEGRREPPRCGGPSAQRGGGGAPPSEVMLDIVSIELDPAPARITQFSLFERALPSPETLSTLTARLSALAGESRVGSAVLLDSHRPDAFAMTRFAPESPGANGSASARDGICAGYGETSPKPLRGEGGANGALIRRQRHPPAIRVSVEHGRPVYIAASKRTMPQGAVVQAAGPWRTSGGWWSGTLVSPKLRSSEGGWSRDEWDVALTSGAVCRIYQDRTTERWFLDGIYD
jgi:protein ImuB